ncbi:MAG TPA: winged helix-turn-helix transcriptional regulator [Acidimicrobiales bacterium]|nr:winged helix-turn-helix transcriptional regulator [Acidimicrobiales bacterium]
MSTRRRLLLLLRKQPGLTVTELAAEMGLTGMGVRRHLEALATDGLVESSECTPRGLGRPAAGWRLSAAGLELFPRRYDALALEVLEDVADHVGPEAVDAVFERRTEKLVVEYDRELADARGLEERVHGLAKIRDEAGYLACSAPGENGDFILTENNCAVHRVAARYPAVCAMEIALLRRVMGPDVEVTRIAHTMAGDAVCAYRMQPRDRD